MIQKKIKSPCQLVCTYDDDRICFGCYRSVDEINEWDSYNDDEKLKVLENTAKRRVEKSGDSYYGFG